MRYKDNKEDFTKVKALSKDNKQFYPFNFEEVLPHTDTAYYYLLTFRCKYFIFVVCLSFLYNFIISIKVKVRQVLVIFFF